MYTEAELNDAFAALDSGEYGAVLRAKGIVAGPQGWLHFDYVPGEGNVRAGAPDYTGRILRDWHRPSRTGPARVVPFVTV